MLELSKRKLQSRFIYFLVSLVLCFYIGYLIGKDAANRDRRNSMKIEKTK